MQTVRLRTTKRELKKRLQSLPRGLTSGGEVGQAFKNHFAFYLFERIRKNYLKKSAGGADEFGTKWKPLDKRTIAYRPIPGQKKTKGGRGLLTAGENARWKGIFRSQYLRLMAQTGDEAKSKAMAARIAWAIVKSEGAKTKLEVYGNRKVPIGRVTDRLLNSVSPGTMSGNRYYKRKDQAFTYSDDGITFGSLVPYSTWFNRKRKIIPPATNMAKAGWFGEISRKCVRAMARVIGGER